MTEREKAREASRKYLAGALKEAGLEMARASTALGLNHAYVQQYISRGKPVWLPEQIREGLVKLVPGLDPERLKPPAAGLRPQLRSRGGYDQAVTYRLDQAQVEAPRFGQFVDDPGALQLLEIWRRITPEQRAIALRILEQLTSAGPSGAAKVA